MRREEGVVNDGGDNGSWKPRTVERMASRCMEYAQMECEIKTWREMASTPTASTGMAWA